MMKLILTNLNIKYIFIKKEKIMNIGIDVDAVLLDWEKGLLAMAEIFDIEECRGNGIVNNTYFIQDQYDWTTDEKEKFKNK